MPRALLFLAFLSALSAPASAQIIRGRVTDAATGSPVTAASIKLIAPDSTVSATVSADSSGQYLLRAARSGRYVLLFERIGYAPRRSQEIELSGSGLYELSVALSPSAVPVAPVEVKVEARVPALERSGFYDRKKMGQGHFIERPLIEAREGRLTSELFHGITGVRVLQKSGGGYHVILRGGYATGFGRNPHCPPRVLLDGVPVHGIGETFDLDLIQRNEIEAIEVYRSPAQIPAQYGGAESRCGVILLWRRVGIGE
jgi:hypothetical protein